MKRNIIFYGTIIIIGVTIGLGITVYVHITNPNHYVAKPNVIYNQTIPTNGQKTSAEEICTSEKCIPVIQY